MNEKIKKIKMLILDVDGVLANGDITYLDDGTELKAFDVQDGMGITLARLGGLKTGIITGRKSPIIERRVKDLKIDTLSQGSFNKLQPYLDILEKFNLSDEEICYMGDDVLDLVLLKRVGFSVTAANGRDEVKAVCDYTTKASGGRGAVRELVDLILKQQGKFDAIIEKLPTLHEA